MKFTWRTECLGTIAYSYFVWRDDPDRDLLGGKLPAD